MNNLHGKVCIVTGSTSGIGLVTAKNLAQMGATIVLVARDEARGKSALAEVIECSGNDNAELLMCDFSSQPSIVAFTEAFKRKHTQLDILVNNAGMMSNERLETDSGIELTFAVNHLGYFITTNLLLDMLKESPASRIIVVASDLHQQGKIDPNDIMHKHDYHGFTAYCDSKLANLLFTYKMAAILQGSGTTINALHPGVIKTKFGINDRNSDMRFPMGRVSPEVGAKAQIYLSASPEVQGISGKYFNEMCMERSSAMSYDEALADVLWQKSMEYSSMSIK
ncbi:MAG: SDR family oxidoreductase [Ectothiorhodospiraceae bacterium]|nr:SDR family oxidoreductase [Ectothiorhodospiraceae bacterium]